MSTRWNYQVVEVKVQMFGKALTERAQEELARLGQMGWELVSAVQSNAADSIRLFLKKQA
jgi:L-amino acid N-acyltransferase YncA